MQVRNLRHCHAGIVSFDESRLALPPPPQKKKEGINFIMQGTFFTHGSQTRIVPKIKKTNPQMWKCYHAKNIVTQITMF